MEYQTLGNGQVLENQIRTMLFLRSYKQREMIEMDRFVKRLSGESTEVIRRKSTDNHLTMKESGMTINNLLYCE